MSSLASIKTQIQTLITLANDTTGNSDTTLTACVNTLIAGYGQSSEPVPLFTNLMEDSRSYIKTLNRWSLSGRVWSTHTADSIVVPVDFINGTNIIRVRGITDDPSYNYLYYGDTSTNGQKFTLSIVSNPGTQGENEYIYTIPTSSQMSGYITFTIASGSKKEDIIVTLNEEIVYE